MKTAGRHPVVIRNIQTSRGVVQYSIYDFLKEIENKPVIWNRMHIDNKNTAILDQNWNNLGRIFVPYINQLDEEEKTQIVDELKKHWLVIRKTLMKGLLLKKKGKGTHCHYLHHIEFFLNSKKIYLKDIATEEELQKLKENEIKIREAAGLSPPKNTNRKRPRQKGDNADSGSHADKASTSKRANADVSNSPRVRENSQQTLNNVCDPMSMCETASHQTTEDDDGHETSFDYRKQQQRTNSRIQRFATESAPTNSSNMANNSYDPNQAFFDSLKPSLRKLNDSQKLDFKIEVLKTLRKYKLY
ncbi:uncharacterized protein LOC135949266 [Calliphora vicina]|uniref:uncharacterized protein LOC135949266 n=1 Tax=Calliphora vicina TaxID=7373 RepID=UPI00325B37E1